MKPRGISDDIFDVAEGGLTDGEPMEFLFGNPTQNSGKFYRVNFGSERNGWNHGSIDSRTSRFTNKALIAEWAELYGEDSDWFRYRVKGEAPRVGFSAFIPPGRGGRLPQVQGGRLHRNAEDHGGGRGPIRR